MRWVDPKKAAKNASQEATFDPLRPGGGASNELALLPLEVPGLERVGPKQLISEAMRFEKGMIGL